MRMADPVDEKQVLKANYAYLVSKLNPDSIAPSLLAQGLLTDHEYDLVTAQPVKSKANEIILAGLKKRAPGFLERFISVLKEDSANRNIVDKLRAT